MLFGVEGHRAGADVLRFMGYAKGILAKGARGRSVDFEPFAGPDDLLKLYSLYAFDIQILLLGTGNDRSDHVQLGNTGQDRVAGEMTGKPWRVILDTDLRLDGSWCRCR